MNNLLVVPMFITRQPHTPTNRHSLLQIQWDETTSFFLIPLIQQLLKLSDAGELPIMTIRLQIRHDAPFRWSMGLMGGTARGIDNSWLGRLETYKLVRHGDTAGIFLPAQPCSLTMIWHLRYTSDMNPIRAHLFEPYCVFDAALPNGTGWLESPQIPITLLYDTVGITLDAACPAV